MFQEMLQFGVGGDGSTVKIKMFEKTVNLVKGENNIISISELGIDYNKIYAITGVLVTPDKVITYGLPSPLLQPSGDYMANYGIALRITNTAINIITNSTWSGYTIKLIIMYID